MGLTLRFASRLYRAGDLHARPSRDDRAAAAHASAASPAAANAVATLATLATATSSAALAAALALAAAALAAVARTAAARTAAAFLPLVFKQPRCFEGCSQRSCHSQRDALVWHVLMRPTPVFVRERLSTPISRVIPFLL